MTPQPIFADEKSVQLSIFFKNIAIFWATNIRKTYGETGPVQRWMVCIWGEKTHAL